MQNCTTSKKQTLASHLITTAIVMIAFMPHDSSRADVFVVSSTADSGAGSLRGQIAGANTTAGGDTIIFAIPGTGPHTIQPLSPLPDITDELTINGYTQTGASPATATTSASIMIEIDGSLAGPNASGITSVNGNLFLQGLCINRFSGNGIDFATRDTCAIAGNYIGTDISGMLDHGNGCHGIYLHNPSISTIGGQIGGPSPADRNIISGNDSCGICADSSWAYVHVYGNYIGTDYQGTDDLGNGFHGIESRKHTSLYAGGPLAGQGNIISGNDGCGIYIHHTSSFLSRVEGNFIGTDKTGTTALGNAGAGLFILESRANQIGETTPDARNIISANVDVGIMISGASSIGNVIEGNFIGTDISGTTGIGNGTHGISLYRANETIIGGTATDARNIISSNGFSGIHIDCSENIIQGNIIGADITGTVPLGNYGAGIFFWSYDAVGNLVGGTSAGEGNLIAYNAFEGVLIGYDANAIENSILGNSIHSNAGLGIDHTTHAWPTDGPTLNDPGDGDTGPNGFLNHPVLVVADPGPPLTLIDVFYNGTPNEEFRFEFFINEEADPTGYGEGGIYDGWATGITDGSGNVDFSVYFDPPLEWGFSVSATATDTAGNTSEFSPVVYIGELADLGGYLTPILNLEWPAMPQAAEYWVYGEENDHYFEPELVLPYGNRKDIVPGSIRDWSSNEGIGDIDWNMTYLIIGVGDYGQIISRSNRFGEFDFSSN